MTNVSSDQCVVDYNYLNGLGKQSGISIVPATQYGYVAHERVNVSYIMQVLVIIITYNDCCSHIEN